MIPPIPLLEQRAIEANVFHAVYTSLIRSLGQKGALEAVEHTVHTLGMQAGRSFAAQAPQGPSFAHFATVIDQWQASGALQVEDVLRTKDRLTFKVTRCAYVEKYKAMGLPSELAGLLSCGRDEPFALGYSPNLSFHRPQTLATGHSACTFCFMWRAS